MYATSYSIIELDTQNNSPVSPSYCPLPPFFFQSQDIANRGRSGTWRPGRFERRIGCCFSNAFISIGAPYCVEPVLQPLHIKLSNGPSSPTLSLSLSLSICSDTKKSKLYLVGSIRKRSETLLEWYTWSWHSWLSDLLLLLAGSLGARKNNPSATKGVAKYDPH